MTDSSKKQSTQLHPKFGHLIWDPNTDCFRGKHSWSKMMIEIIFYTDENQSLTPSLEIAENLWTAEHDWNERLEDFITQKLIPLKNKSWLEKGEPLLTEGECKKRIKLLSITIFPEGQFEFYYHDDDIFDGHTIQITGTQENGFLHLNLLG